MRIQDRQIAGVGHNHTISDRAHLAAAKALHRRRVNLVRPPAETEVEIRSLAAYDTALGIVGPGQVRDGGHEIGDS